MTNHKKSKSVFNVGVDVGKAYLDVCIHEKPFIIRKTILQKGLNVS